MKNLIRHGESILAVLVLGAVLAIFLVCSGCTPDEVATAQADARKAAQTVQAVIVAYEANEATVDQVVAAAAAASPKIGGQILQASLALKANVGTLDAVKNVAAGVADSLAAPSPSPAQ